MRHCDLSNLSRGTVIMSNRYLIRLKPIDTFFFGGEVTFGKLGDKQEGSYLVKSRQFPQQSAVLGMIRRELMIQEGLLTRKRNGEWIEGQDNIEAAHKLVGKEQFDKTKTNQNYGIIKTISPVFLWQENEPYILRKEFGTLEKEEGKSYINGIEKPFLPYLKNFDPKKGIQTNVISQKNCYRLDDLLTPIERVGNQKKEMENAFFKLTAYKFERDFEFAFILELNQPYNLQENLVLLGGNNSYFKMRITPQFEKSFEELFDFVRPPQNAIMLLSDSYLSGNVLEHCDFSVTHTLSFRNIKSKIEKHKGQFEKHEQVDLYERGSIFFNYTDELKKILDNHNLHTVGMNYYIQGEHVEN